MKFILYPLLYFLSILPIKLLWLISFCLGFIMNYIVRYREKIILTNLRNSFPDKTEKQIKKIKKSFYYHSSRLLIESFKVLTANQKQISKLVYKDELSDFDKMMNEEKGALILTGHLGNFELGGQFFTTESKLKVFTAYRKFSSGFWEDFMSKMRARFNSYLIPATQIIKTIFKYKDEGLFVAFLNDQSPQYDKDHTWVHFLNQETMFFIAPAKIAVKFKLPVYFVYMWRKPNGKYNLGAKLITQNPENHIPEQIIKDYTKLLEEAIVAHPEEWLWSHKRWKRKKENDPNLESLPGTDS